MTNRSLGERGAMRLAAAIGCVTWVAACGTGDDNASTVPPADAAADSTVKAASGGDAALDGGAEAAGQDAGAVVQMASVRVGNLTAAMPEGVDLCLGVATGDAGIAYMGPILNQNFPPDDAGNIAQAAFPSLSAFVNIPSGSYSLRFVAAGAPDCTQSVLDAAGKFTMGTRTTVALIGDPNVAPDAGPDPLSALVMNNDLTTPAAVVCGSTVGCAEIKFINADPAYATGGGATLKSSNSNFMSSFKNIAYGVVASKYANFDDPEQVSALSAQDTTTGCSVTAGVTDVSSLGFTAVFGPGSVSTVVLVPDPWANVSGTDDGGDAGDGSACAATLQTDMLVVFTDNGATTCPLTPCLGCDAASACGM